jgi:hypothetical protein
MKRTIELFSFTPETTKKSFFVRRKDTDKQKVSSPFGLFPGKRREAYRESQSPDSPKIASSGCSVSLTSPALRNQWVVKLGHKCTLSFTLSDLWNTSASSDQPGNAHLVSELQAPTPWGEHGH